MKLSLRAARVLRAGARRWVEDMRDRLMDRKVRTKPARSRRHRRCPSHAARVASRVSLLASRASLVASRASPLAPRLSRLAYGRFYA
jgi:hypothetical protein